MVEELLRLLGRGVEKRQLSDVPLGFPLSGGMGSSLVTALAARMSKRRIKAFCLSMREADHRTRREAIGGPTAATIRRSPFGRAIQARERAIASPKEQPRRIAMLGRCRGPAA